jgi:hypothetical protein
MKIQYLLSMTLSLSLMACQVAAPLVSAPDTSPSHARTMVALPAKTSIAVDHTAQLQSNGNTEQVRLQLNTPGFRTQLAQPEQLAFIQVTLIGEDISDPIYQDGVAFLPVSGDSLTATLSDIPTRNGKLRLVQVQGFNADQEPLDAFQASAWYRSQSTVTTVNLTLNRAQNLLYDILHHLFLDRPVALVGLDIPALQTLLLTEVLEYTVTTGEFGKDPSLFDAEAMAALITGGQSLPLAETLQEKTLTLQDVSVNITRPGGVALAEDVRFVLSDPLSRPMLLSAGTVSGTPLSFNGIPPGHWLLSAYNLQGDLLASTGVVVDSTVTVETNPLELPFQGEFRLNTVTSGFQDGGVVASNAAGDFVVVWRSSGQDGSGDGVYGQRYNASGVAQGAEFRVNTYTSDTQYAPSVAMDSAGNFAVVWQSWGQDGNGEGVYGQRYNTLGVPQGAEFRVNSYTTGAQEAPSVAMDSDGDFVVTWTSKGQDGNDYGIYAQRYNASGIAQDSEFQVNTYTGASSYHNNSAVAMDSDGDFVVTWTSVGQDGSDYGVYAQRYDALGGAQDTEFRVNSYTTGSQNRPAIAMDADGDFVVAWQSDRLDGNSYGIYAQRYDALGVAQNAEFQVNTYDSNTQYIPAIAMNGAGDFVVTWTSEGQDGSTYGVYAQAYNPSGGSKGSEFQVNTYTSGEQYESSVAMNSAGHFVVTWRSNGQVSLNDMYAQRYGPTGVQK